MMNSNPQKVIVVGNGYLPYLISLCIQKKFKQHAPELVIVDLGNTSKTEFLQSLGSMKHFHSDLGLPETEFVKTTKAEINLGFDYAGFAKSELFCDAQYGFDLDNRRFFHLFNKFRQFHPADKLENYCLTAQLARGGRFTPPSPNARSLYANIRYGYRLTGDAYAEFLKSKLPASGIRIFQAQSVSANLDNNGFIANIQIPDVGTLEGDLFIDACEGRSIKSALGSRHLVEPLLPANLNLHIQRSTEPQHQKSTISNIAVENKKLILSGTYRGIDHQVTLADAANASQHEPDEPFFVDTTPWIKNCISMGHAFTNRVPILIDNSHFNQGMLLRLLELWPRSRSWIQESRAYNQGTMAEFQHIRDMDLLHLVRTFDRADLLSDHVRYKLDIFKEIGKVVYYENEVLQETQWPILLNALGVVPATLDLTVQNCTHSWLSQELLRIKSSLAKAAEAAPLYRDFISKAHG